MAGELEMKFTIFYSWQSDLPNSTNRGFIQKALEDAAKEIRTDDTITVDPVIERDTAGVAGSPDIASTIFEKIDKCNAFVCDVSIINHKSRKNRKTPNPNVLIELGYAVKRLGWNYIIMVLNSNFGRVEHLPFDLKMKRVITYLSKETDPNKATERKDLQSKLKHAMIDIVRKQKASKSVMPKAARLPNEVDKKWCKEMNEQASDAMIESVLMGGHIELFSVIAPPRQNMDNLKLIKAVRESQIPTFGWPVGIMDENREKLRPKPLRNGIVLSCYRLGGRETFDFWALKNDLSFYLMKNYFEDVEVSEHDRIFFNTRIHQTAEMLLFLSNIYRKFDIDGEREVYISISHSNLKNRKLSSIGGLRNIQPRGPAFESEIKTEKIVQVNDLSNATSLLVNQLISPLFSLFDYFELPQKIYDEIVDSFRKGKLT
jgi:hypothetical protein